MAELIVIDATDVAARAGGRMRTKVKCPLDPAHCCHGTVEGDPATVDGVVSLLMEWHRTQHGGADG